MANTFPELLADLEDSDYDFDDKTRTNCDCTKEGPCKVGVVTRWLGRYGFAKDDRGRSAFLHPENFEESHRPVKGQYVSYVEGYTTISGTPRKVAKNICFLDMKTAEKKKQRRCGCGYYALRDVQ